MNYELLCQNSATGTAYEITELAESVSYQTTLGGQPGKLTVTLREDPRGILALACGSILSFAVDGAGVFFGYVFTIGASETGAHKITAYDQMRYLKNKGIYLTRNQTASQIFEKVCADSFTRGRWEVVVPSAYVPPAHNHTGKTLYETIYYAIEQSILHETGKYYFVKDRFGVLQFTELGRELTNLVIGDAALLTGYQYEISIDKETYNTVIYYQDDEEAGRRVPWMARDSSTQKRWGILQSAQQADLSLNEAQLREIAERYLRFHNRETRTLKLTALGQKELVAGSGFRLRLEKLGLNEALWITSATHNYEKDYHTMSLEVAAPISEEPAGVEFGKL